MKNITYIILLIGLVVAPIGCMKQNKNLPVGRDQAPVTFSDSAKIKLLESHLLKNSDSSKEQKDYLNELKAQVEQERSE